MTKTLSTIPKPDIIIRNSIVELEEPHKTLTYHQIIENVIKMVKKSYMMNHDKEWKMLEENLNFSIYMKCDNSNNKVWSRAESDIICNIEKVNIYSYYSRYILDIIA